MRFPLPAFVLVRQLPANMYISQPYILELGLKPDLVYNPRCVASTTPICLISPQSHSLFSPYSFAQHCEYEGNSSYLSKSLYHSQSCAKGTDPCTQQLSCHHSILRASRTLRSLDLNNVSMYATPESSFTRIEIDKYPGLSIATCSCDLQAVGLDTN